ncbi:MAG: mannose-1-phosphate guanylyltransferase [Planctomycetes bacterium RBG_16_64_10]|nr:MAG: mannose-1-phosphate guanylyltransferase [Planctomycetes bacterium RBG_16_64_10]
MLHAVIMAGGTGTRFWPASRSTDPKQLLRLAGPRSMIQMTVDRLGNLVTPDRILIVTSESLVGALRQQLPELPAMALLGEPCRRDTAPCIGWSAMQLQRHDPEATMAVMPADHVIRPAAAFQDAIRYAARLVAEQPTRLVTFGIRPTYPAATFGYIERGAALPGGTAYRVQHFREKPDPQTARDYLAAGNFFWNSGIFVWRAATILGALAKHQPALYGHLQQIDAAWQSPAYEATLRREFAAIRGVSIDYAVMEQASEVAVIEAPFEWDDVGSWQALSRLHGTDACGNTVLAKHVGLRTRGSIVRGADDHLIVTLGLTDCLVVHTPDATLVANKHDEESIRQVVQLIAAQGWHEYL